MNLRRLALVVPVLALFKLAACSDQDNPSGTNLPGDDGGTEGGNEGGNPDGSVITTSQCQQTKPAANNSTGRVIKGTVLLPESSVEGEVFYDKGRIVCADKNCSNALGYADAAIITCTEAVISPGLINAHDHISFANNAPKTSPADPNERYEHRHEWRKGYGGHTKITVAGGAKDTAVMAAELRFVMSGVTSGATSGGGRGMMRNVDNAGMREGLTLQPSTFQTFPLGDSSDANSQATLNKPPGDCSYTGRDTTAGMANDLGYLPHIAEGVSEAAHNEMYCTSDGSGADPTHDLIKPQTAVIHGIAVTAAEAAKMHANKTSLIWSPRSNISLYGNTAAVIMYDRVGVPIALGTDWLPSGSMNIQRELKCADELNQTYFAKHFTDKQLWQMVSTNAALAVGWGHALGRLKKGYVADVAVFNARGRANPYRAIIDGTAQDTVLVLRGGIPIYGDAELLSSDTLNSKDCEDIDVCGQAKKACVKKDIGGVDLSQVRAEGEKYAPLFVCKTNAPPKEPTCIPSRGATATAPNASVYSGGPKVGDKDGDGVPDDQDNCPNVFNPIRPMDGAKQADADGDGIGDACDKCPNDPGESCAVRNGNDVDEDGIPNGDDNCAKVANADQADGDGDGKGAVCDLDYTGASCDGAGESNPGPNFCQRALTIEQIRNTAAPGHPPQFTVRAKLTGVYVTAVKKDGGGSFGFFIQSPVAAPFQGMFVATPGNPPNLAVGDKIDIDGDYEEVFGLSQLSYARWTVTNPGTTLPFAALDVDPALAKVTGATGEQFEGVLCRVVGPVDVTQKNADNPTEDPANKSDFDEFAIMTGVNLRVDDNLYDALDNNYPVGTMFPNVTGICGFSFSNRKIWPRSPADLQ